MIRIFYVSDDLDDLEDAQEELLHAGFSDQQLHVLSDDEDGLFHHHLHPVNVFEKTNLLHSIIKGASIGLVLSFLVIMFLAGDGWAGKMGWLPVLLVGGLTLGFTIWEAGLLGIQKINVEYQRFEKALKQGCHVMIIDCQDNQLNAVNQMADHHPRMMARM